MITSISLLVRKDGTTTPEQCVRHGFTSTPLSPTRCPPCDASRGRSFVEERTRADIPSLGGGE